MKRLLLIVILLAGTSSVVHAQRGGRPSNVGHFGNDQSTADVQKAVKIRATEEQRAQLDNCFASAERLRVLAAETKNPANLSRTELDGIRRWSKLQRLSLESNHEAFLGSLNADQQVALEDRLRKLERTWFELAARYEATDHDLEAAATDAKRLAGDAKDLEKSVKKWLRQHREVGLGMGVKG